MLRVWFGKSFTAELSKARQYLRVKLCGSGSEGPHRTKASSSPSMKYAELDIGRNRVRGLVDTGAAQSVCSWEFVKCNNLHPYKLPQSKFFITVSGQKMESKYTVAIFASWNDEKHWIVAYVLDKVGPNPLILGIPFLQVFRVTLKFSDNGVEMSNSQTPIYQLLVNKENPSGGTHSDINDLLQTHQDIFSNKPGELAETEKYVHLMPGVKP